MKVKPVDSVGDVDGGDVVGDGNVVGNVDGDVVGDEMDKVGDVVTPTGGTESSGCTESSKEPVDSVGSRKEEVAKPPEEEEVAKPG